MNPTDGSFRRPPLTPRLVAILALLCAMTPLSIDMYLPALPSLVATYQVSRGEVQLTLSAFIVAFGAGQILYGPLGDHFGRRPVLLGGVLLYIVASAACAVAQSIEQLIVLRFLQGLAACGVPSMARAMVRDLADRDRAAAALSTIMASVSLAPMIAPFIGANILDLADWRAIFWTLAGFGVLAWLAAGIGAPESLGPALRGPLDFRLVLKRYGELMQSRLFLGYALCSACVFAGMFGFLSGSSFVLIETYGLSPRTYSYCFAANVVAITAGASMNAVMVRRLGAERVLRIAVWLPAIAGCTLLAAGLFEHATRALGIWPFIPLFVASIAGISVVAPNATSGALQNYPHMAGIASSLIGIVQYGLGAVFGVIVGQLVGGSILPMVAVMAAGGIGCLLAHRLLVRSGASAR